jgi:divalent metal cation (Fe/Co/Zn/Cd) transporter
MRFLQAEKQKQNSIMKIVLALFIAFSSISSFATNISSDEDKMKSESLHTITTELSHALSFHQLTDEANGNVAFVEVRVTNTGALEAINVNAFSESLRQEIRRVINQMHMDTTKVAPGTQIAFKLEFKYSEF